MHLFDYSKESKSRKPEMSELQWRWQEMRQEVLKASRITITKLLSTQDAPVRPLSRRERAPS